MRINQASDNGNVTFNTAEATSEPFNENSWLSLNPDSSPYENRTDNTRFNSSCSAIYSSTTETTETFINYSTATEIGDSKINVEFVVCNRQYRINTQNNINGTHSLPKVNNLEEGNETTAIKRGSFIGESNVYSDDTPIDDDRVFDHSDTDDMSEKGVQSVPRGIVNPNYPGFQHLAHTLQDYSSNIENFYHSENDMTDDDIDIEITDLAYEPESNQKCRTTECKNINNNNITKEILLSPQSDSYLKAKALDRNTQNDIPDLLKTISKNNNNNKVDAFSYDSSYSDTDIENNFNTKDIIGDFNKEVEDEIKQLLNYNINIQDDLEELRKDIKDTFAKPIETTINNISEVVNHVIKKLVETKSDNVNEDTEIKTPEPSVNSDNNEINRENEKNTRKEMNLSRPTFLFIDSANHKIDDAFLSDGKDEINISEYDPDKLSQNVENTIKQLSTELRKIIPKLDEMRERDRLWAGRNKENVSVKDNNSNEVGTSSQSFNLSCSVNRQISDEVIRNYNCNDSYRAVKNLPIKSPPYSDSRAMKDRQKDVTPTTNCYHSAYNINTSVRKNDNVKDVDLGSFDVYNIETALPKLDIDAIENHLRAAKEAERRGLVSNIKRKFSKTAEENRDHIDKTEKPGFRRGLRLFKLKLSKQEPASLPVIYTNDTALSPRAISTADSAHTEIEWPILIDNNPNILDKFTRIVSIDADSPYDKKKRNDREEIRRRLAMGAEAEEYYSLGHTDRPGKKPSLHSRLQSGMNLQICFMNETASDNESQASDMDRNVNYSTKSLSRSSIFSKNSYNSNHPYQTRPLSVNITKHDKISTVQSGAKLKPSSLSVTATKSRSTHSLSHIELKESDFYALQATLQTEARIALAQAKEMARIQMERERRGRAVSPVTEMLRRSMSKASAPLAPDRRRVSRQLLTDMNIAQLQVIVNELHSQIESLNDSLVKLLMARDELHMGQDSMLVDIEDLTRYLGVKEQTKKTKGTAKTGMKRLTSLVNK